MITNPWGRCRPTTERPACYSHMKYFDRHTGEEKLEDEERVDRYDP